MYWLKINYERNEYVVDLDRLSAFACAPNGNITFWLPNSTIPIVINQQSDPEAYQQIFDYIKDIQYMSERLNKEFWIKINYERNDYIVNLNYISSFCHSPNNRLTFWLPDSSIPIIINQQKDPDIYQQILDYIERQTGQQLT
ncbi:MAG: hypothetical protein F6K36_02685 [Symploca sp. SIO3C6]|nr:hypothetical protein [Symploca sp. SIO3C6]NET03776.1 hypothetical protein [Symploca sp. SIO2B6]